MAYALVLQSAFVLAFISPTRTASDVTDLSVPVHQSLDVNLLVNSPILEGTDLELKCLFDVPEGTAVSSVKWYKGIREIFRYEHKPFPKKQALPFGNLTIDEERSHVQLLYMKHVPSFMSGKISCEVTLEDPSAKAITKSAKLLVAVPPTEGPVLEASIIQFSHSNIMHQKLIANCTSPPSKPAVNLTIYINNSPHYARLSNDERVRTHPDISVNNNLVIRRLELELDLTPKHFVNGKLLIKCASTLFGLHDSWSDVYVLDQVLTAPKRHNSHFIGSPFRSVGSVLQSGDKGLTAVFLLVQQFIRSS